MEKEGGLPSKRQNKAARRFHVFKKEIELS